MLSTDFLLASADIRFEEFLRLSARAKRKYIVITRTVRGREYHYVILRKALEEALKQFRPKPEVPTEIVLNLHEYQSDPIVEVKGDQSNWIAHVLQREAGSNLSVLKAEGRVVGVFDPIAAVPNAKYELKGLNFVYRQKAPVAVSAGRKQKAPTRHGKKGAPRHFPQAPPGPPGIRGARPRSRATPPREGGLIRTGARREMTAPRVGAAPPQQSAVDHERYPRATFPDRVALGHEETLEVVIDAVRSPLAAISLTIRAEPGETEVPVLVVVQPGTFEVVGETACEIPVPVDAKPSIPARFTLVAREEGNQEIRVKFYPRGAYAAQLAVRTRVVRTTQQAKAATSKTVRTLSKLPDSPPSADLTMVILEKSRNRGIFYDVGIWSQKLNIAWDSIGQITFPSDPDEQFRIFYSELEQINIAAPEAEERIKAAAQNLYKAIVPERLRSRYWDLRDSIASIQVVSSEPWIPWEILMPWDPDNPSAPNGQFLCERHVFARWLDGLEFPRKDRLQTVKVVAPPGAKLPGAQKELRWIRNFGRQKGFSVTEAVEFNELLTSFRTEQFDVLHFSTHGRFDPKYPTASGLFLQGGVELRPDNLTGPAAAFGKANPLVILNACQTGNLGFSFTRVGGWATSFLEAGASAFIGTQWSVNDETAAEFTQAVYGALNRGDSLGKAVQGARLAARHKGDPSWLAYQLYAYPNAVSQLGH